jgi:hypothetical protein
MKRSLPAIALLLGTGCSSLFDPCAGKMGTCLALIVDSTPAALDRVQIHVHSDGPPAWDFDRESMAPVQSRRFGAPIGLPLTIGEGLVRRDGAATLALSLQGLAANQLVGVGDTTASVVGGRRSEAHVRLTAPGDDGLMSPSDLSPTAADLAGATPADLASTPADLARPLLQVTSTVSGGALVDLTQTGTLDWAHWGFQEIGDFDHKATGNSQISTFTLLPGSTNTKQDSVAGTPFSWNDGMTSNGGHQTASNNVGGIYTQSGGFKITAIADRTLHRLIVFCFVYHARAQMQIALSDSSAPAYADGLWERSDGQIQQVAYTIDYAAATAGQTISVSWSDALTLGTADGVGLNAAALTTP